jgi:hypothetical protein
MKISNEIFEAADAAFESSMETMARYARYDFSPQILAVLYKVLPLIRAEVLEEAALVADAVSDKSRREIRSALDATEIAYSIRAMKVEGNDA